jgi:hypothetical protein
MGETRVDLLRLLENLRDAYPGSLEETILTELVANALDSGARRIDLHADPTAASLTVVDDGKGMSRRSFTRFHDLAVSGKRRGETIGFAGVGVKLGLLVCHEVLTESRTPRAKAALASSWRLASRSRAPWRWIETPGILEGPGTAVRFYLSNPLSPLLDAGFLEENLLAHFQPLFDPAFDGILASHYGDGVRFRVNGRAVARSVPRGGRAPLELRIGRQRAPSGVGFLVRDPALPESDRGVAISTLGKVIRRGWDWLGLAPAGAPDAGGIVEVPSLSESLTLNKGDFIRTGPRGARFLAYRKAFQEAVSHQLEAWGEGPTSEQAPPARTRAVERDLRSILAGLSESYPLVATLVERLSGGQRRLRLGAEPSLRGTAPGLGIRSGTEEGSGATMDGGAAADEQEERGGEGPGTRGTGDDEAGGKSVGRLDSGVSPAGAALPGAGKARQPARYGLHIRMESRPEDQALGRLVESTVWVNDAHPAYRRAVASRAEGYHLALTVALTLAPLAVEPDRAGEFVNEFLTRWGKAGRDGPGRTR